MREMVKRKREYERRCMKEKEGEGRRLAEWENMRGNGWKSKGT
jgi:hypothetical protein